MADLQLPYAFRDLRRPARYKAYYGGRGGGKSSSFAQELIVRGTQQPLRILCCREIQQSLGASVKQLLDDKIQQAGLGGFYHSTQSGIRSPNGTGFLFAGLKSDPETVRSMEGLDIAWIEEANTVSQRSLDLADSDDPKRELRDMVFVESAPHNRSRGSYVPRRRASSKKHHPQG